MYNSMNEIQLRNLLDVLYNSHNQVGRAVKRINSIVHPLATASAKEHQAVQKEAKEMHDIYEQFVTAVDAHIKSLESELFKLTGSIDLGRSDNKAEDAV